MAHVVQSLSLAGGVVGVQTHKSAVPEGGKQSELYRFSKGNEINKWLISEAENIPSESLIENFCWVGTFCYILLVLGNMSHIWFLLLYPELS